MTRMMPGMKRIRKKCIFSDPLQSCLFPRHPRPSSSGLQGSLAYPIPNCWFVKSVNLVFWMQKNTVESPRNR